MTTENNEYKKVIPNEDNILVQDGKTYIGYPNPDKRSKVTVIYENEKGTPMCSAYRAKVGKICRTTAVMPNGRCSKHGGKSLFGLDAPNFKNGRRSKYLPARLVEDYEEALSDEELQSFTSDLAEIDARMNDIYKQMDDGGGGQIFKEIAEANKSFKIANREGDRQMMRESLRRLDDAIKRGNSETYLWSELHSLREQRRRILMSQVKRLQITNQMMTVEKVNLLISALLDAVRQEVKDKKTLSRVSHRFRQITSPNKSRGQLTK